MKNLSLPEFEEVDPGCLADEQQAVSNLRRLLAVVSSATSTEQQRGVAMCALFVVLQFHRERIGKWLREQGLPGATIDSELQLTASLWNRMRERGLCFDTPYSASFSDLYNEAICHIPASVRFFNLDFIARGEAEWKRLISN